MLEALFGRKKRLPHCDELYLKYFQRWLSPELKARRGFNATRPDMLTEEYLVGFPKGYEPTLSPSNERLVTSELAKSLNDAKASLPMLLNVGGAPDESWVDAFDKYYDRARIHDTIAKSNPAEAKNAYLVACLQFGSVLADVMASQNPRLIWKLESPYWESSLVDPKSGTEIPPFHFAIKKMSEYGVDDGFTAKLRMMSSVLNETDG